MKAYGVVSLAFVLVVSCAEAPRVGILGVDDMPKPARPAAHVHFDTTMDLPSDEQVVEPSQPFVSTPGERSLAHIHTPGGVCSGVVVGPHLVATAHQCVAGARGLSTLTGEYRIELPSSSLTWATRTPSKVMTPDCNWDLLDVAVFIVAEPMDWVQPPRVGTVPGPGAKVQALGFGRCEGERRGLRDKSANIIVLDSQAFVIDAGLCRGDVGGAVMYAEGSFLGIVSHQDDPDNSPRRTTTIFRGDTTAVRDLFAQARAIADGADPSKFRPIACE